MRATIMYRAGATYALVRITRPCICGSDLWPYNLTAASTARLTWTRVPDGFCAMDERKAIKVMVKP